MTGPDPDPNLRTVTHEEYVEAQQAFPGFVDEEGNPTEDDIAEDDEYVVNPDA